MRVLLPFLSLAMVTGAWAQESTTEIWPAPHFEVGELDSFLGDFRGTSGNPRATIASSTQGLAKAVEFFFEYRVRTKYAQSYRFLELEIAHSQGRFRVRPEFRFLITFDKRQGIYRAWMVGTNSGGAEALRTVPAQVEGNRLTLYNPYRDPDPVALRRFVFERNGDGLRWTREKMTEGVWRKDEAVDMRPWP